MDMPEVYHHATSSSASYHQRETSIRIKLINILSIPHLPISTSPKEEVRSQETTRPSGVWYVKYQKTQRTTPLCKHRQQQNIRYTVNKVNSTPLCPAPHHTSPHLCSLHINNQHQHQSPNGIPSTPSTNALQQSACNSAYFTLSCAQS
jgi:hypothetical protein